MTTSQLLAFFGCIPLRIFLVYLSTIIPTEHLYLFGIVLLAMSIGFLFLYFKRIRMNPPESGTGTAWWHNFRLIHGALYLTAAIYAFQKNKLIWIPLTIDILFGISVFLFHYQFKI